MNRIAVAKKLGYEVKWHSKGVYHLFKKNVIVSGYDSEEQVLWDSIDLTSPYAVEDMKRYVEGRGYDDWRVERKDKTFEVKLFQYGDNNHLSCVVSSDIQPTEAEAWMSVLLQAKESEGE